MHSCTISYPEKYRTSPLKRLKPLSFYLPTNVMASGQTCGPRQWTAKWSAHIPLEGGWVGVAVGCPGIICQLPVLPGCPHWGSIWFLNQSQTWISINQPSAQVSVGWHLPPFLLTGSTSETFGSTRVAERCRLFNSLPKLFYLSQYKWTGLSRSKGKNTLQCP